MNATAEPSYDEAQVEAFINHMKHKVMPLPRHDRMVAAVALRSFGTSVLLLLKYTPEEVRGFFEEALKVTPDGDGDVGFISIADPPSDFVRDICKDVSASFWHLGAKEGAVAAGEMCGACTAMLGQWGMSTETNRKCFEDEMAGVRSLAMVHENDLLWRARKFLREKTGS